MQFVWMRQDLCIKKCQVIIDRHFFRLHLVSFFNVIFPFSIKLHLLLDMFVKEVSNSTVVLITPRTS